MLMPTVCDLLPAGRRAWAVRLDLHGAWFAHAAGQAVVIGMPGVDAKRTYSIASPPPFVERSGCIELLIGTGDTGLAPCRPGTRVTLEGPFGTFTFPHAPDERQFVFVAGGTGIAPVRSMLTPASRVPGASIAVLYSARTPDDFAYGDELQSLASATRIHLKQTITRPAPSRPWSGGRGRFRIADLSPYVQRAPALWFLCGPAGLVTAMQQQLDALGVSPAQIRTEAPHVQHPAVFSADSLGRSR